MAHPIYPYQAPRELAQDLWQIEGSFRYGVPRNMTIYRTRNRELVLYSVIAMHEDDMRALEALGTPSVMVIAHDRHHFDAAFYKARYPELRIIAPLGARPIKGLTYDGDLEALAAYGVRAYVLPGNSYHDVVMELPTEKGLVLCVCESLTSTKGWRGVGIMALLMRIIGPPGGHFGVARAVKWREIRDRLALARWLREAASRATMLMTGHGAPLVDDLRQSFQSAAAAL